MKLMMKAPWNIVSYEGKYNILYNNDDKNVILYNEYMKMV